MAGLEYCSNGYGPPDGEWGRPLDTVQEAVTAWHSNIIRPPMNQDFWFGCGGADLATYRGFISDIVDFCSKHNAYVILDLHWSGEADRASPPCGGAWGTDSRTKQQYMADQNAVTFWSSLAGLYANNPAVLFDLYNEPYSSNKMDDDAAWTVWQMGGMGDGAGFSTPGMQRLLNAVRSAGANNICLAGGLAWCADLSHAANYPLTNVGNGIVYSAHFYADHGITDRAWNGQVPGTLLASHPVLVGEMGPSVFACNQDDTTFDTNLSAWIKSTPGFVGATAWSMTVQFCPNMLTDWNWEKSSWGSAVSIWLAAPVPTCMPGQIGYATGATSAGSPALTPTPPVTSNVIPTGPVSPRYP